MREVHEGGDSGDSRSIFCSLLQFLGWVDCLNWLTEKRYHKDATTRNMRGEESMFDYDRKRFVYVQHKANDNSHPSRRKIHHINIKEHAYTSSVKGRILNAV